MATTNTTEPITLRGGFVPVLRYGNFAGPGYAGRLGLESPIQHPAINNGKRILASELTKTPEGVAQFMQVALKTEPNGYMDSVTRSHDVEYTFAEIRFMDSVKTQFDGKLPHELTAQDKQDPAFKQLETARDAEYWQADKRMLTSIAQYQPTDFVDVTYRGIALNAFYAKAESGLFGYGLGPEATDFYNNLKAIDSKITVPTFGDSIKTLGTATTLARADFEDLATLPITPQERQFFNQHLKPGQYVDVSQTTNGDTITYGERDSTNRIVVPEKVTDNLYYVQTKIGGDTVTMTLDKRDKDNPVFTKEVTHNGEVVSTETIRAQADDGSVKGVSDVRAYESVVTDNTGQVLGTKNIAKPELPDSTIPPDLQAKIDAVKSGDVAQIVAIPAVHNSNGVDGSDAHFSHYPADNSTEPATPTTTPSTSPPDGSDAHLNHYPQTGNTGTAPVVHVTVGSGTASNGTDATTTSTGIAPGAMPDGPQDGDATATPDGSDAHFNHHPATDATPTGDDITDAATQQIIKAFSEPLVISKDNDVQLAGIGVSNDHAAPYSIATTGSTPLLIDTSGPDGSDAHFRHYPVTPESGTTPTAALPFKPDLTEDQANTLLADLGFKPEPSRQPGIQTADASSVMGTGTISSAGTGGIGLGNTSTPNDSETNQPVAPVEPEQPATNTVAPANTPTNPVDAGPDGSDAHFLHHPAPSIAAPLAEGLTLVNTLIGLKNWGSQSDLSHLSTAVSLYNQPDHLGTSFGGNGNNLPGNLGQFGAGLGLITSLQSGNPIAVASSGASFANAMAGSNVIPIPVINILNIGNALQSGDPFAIASSVAACFPPWGTVASVVISIIGSLVPKDIPEPPNGAVHYTWDETGAITIQTDHDISDGAKTATSTAGSVLGLLQSMVTANNDDNDTKGQSSNNLGIDPSRMPRIGFTAGMSWLEITHADGSTTKETINPDTVGERLLQIAVDNDALAPQWQIQTAQAHAKAAQAAQAEAQAQATTTDEPVPESASAIDGQTPAATTSTVHNTAAVFGLEGTVQEASDHKTQTFAALVVHLHSPGAQEAITAIGNTPVTATNTVLQDVDGDGFWEQTQWVASKDDAGNAQGMLVLDHNNNRLIEAADILHLGGNSNERNSLAWLDSNSDGVLDASDPAFAAIKGGVNKERSGAFAKRDAGSGQIDNKLRMNDMNCRPASISSANNPAWIKVA